MGKITGKLVKRKELLRELTRSP